MLNHCYVIKGNPIPQQRPRYGIKNVYDSQKQQKLLWQVELNNQHNDSPLLTGPLVVELGFFFMPAQTISAKKRAQFAGKPHEQRPDIDNLIKWVLDNCNGIVYKDDSTIVKTIAFKCYDMEPRTEFIFRRLTSLELVAFKGSRVTN